PRHRQQHVAHIFSLPLLLRGVPYNRILVRATNWLGDAVMSLPALRALRQRFPQAEIAILAKPWVADLYQREPFCDRMIPYTARTLAEKWGAGRALAREDFDCAILLQNAFEAAAVDKETIWLDRYRSIVNLEDHLHRNGTRIVKFFLHLSWEEQRKRFLKRIDQPAKNWKFSADDMRERGFWKQYTKAYEACLGSTSTRIAPWYIVPADDKDTAQLIVSHVIFSTLRDL